MSAIPTPIILATATPAEGVEIPVGSDPGGLAGWVVTGTLGPPVTLAISRAGGAYGTPALPLTLQGGDVLRLTRTDTSARSSVILAVAPNPGGDIVVVDEIDGSQTINGVAGPYPTKPMFEGLQGRVTDLEAGGGGGSSSGGPVLPSADVLYFNTITNATTRSVTLQTVEIWAGPNLPTLSATRMHIPFPVTPAQVSYLELRDFEDVTLITFGSGDLRYTDEFGGTTIEFPPLFFGAEYDRLHLRLSAPRTVTAQTAATTNVLMVRLHDAGNNLISSATVRVVLYSAGAALAPGPLGPYALRVVRTPTPWTRDVRDGYSEVVAPSGQPPYLRLRHAQGWWSLPFTAETGGE